MNKFKLKLGRIWAIRVGDAIQLMSKKGCIAIFSSHLGDDVEDIAFEICSAVNAFKPLLRSCKIAKKYCKKGITSTEGLFTLKEYLDDLQSMPLEEELMFSE